MDADLDVEGEVDIFQQFLLHRGVRLGGRDDVRDKSDRLVGEKGDAENVSKKVEISNFPKNFQKRVNVAKHDASIGTN